MSHCAKASCLKCNKQQETADKNNLSCRCCFSKVLSFLLVFEYMKRFALTKQRCTISTDNKCKTEDVDTFERNSLPFIYVFLCYWMINEDVPHFGFIPFLGIRFPPQHVGTVNRLFILVMMRVKVHICG